jgi:hypothetical protein
MCLDEPPTPARKLYGIYKYPLLSARIRFAYCDIRPKTIGRCGL